MGNRESTKSPYILSVLLFIISIIFLKCREPNYYCASYSYRVILNDVLLPEIILESMWFQQDGATVHTAPKPEF